MVDERDGIPAPAALTTAGLCGVTRIVSGGQTGADRAALDWAIANRIDHGGWCPLGRRADDGEIPLTYRLTETPSAAYEQRTRWNVRDSDATLIFSLAAELSGGSQFTQDVALRFGKPCLHVYPGVDGPRLIRDFLATHAVRVLNVAGPRASREPGVAQSVQTALDAVLRLCTGGRSTTSGSGPAALNAGRT
ncbi:MAG: putative molybdenum carrier protein [Chromatiales bacterium]